MPPPKRRTSDASAIIKVGGISVTMRNLAIIIVLAGSLCGSAWAAGAAYSTITNNQITILERLTENDVKVAELGKEQAEIKNRNLQLEREIVHLRKEFEQAALGQWTEADDELAMMKHERDGQ